MKWGGDIYEVFPSLQSQKKKKKKEKLILLKLQAQIRFWKIYNINSINLFFCEWWLWSGW
jgi:hypothetical protein